MVIIMFEVSLQHNINQCKGGAEEMKELHKTLLDGYDPTVRPSSNYSNPTVVTVQLHVSIVMGLDAQKQLIFLRAFLKVRWDDELLQWAPKQFGDIDRMLLPPALILANEHDTLGSDDMLVSVSSKGHVSWEPPFYLEGSCKKSAEVIPFTINAEMMCLNKLRVPNEPVVMKYMVTNGEYEISSDGASKEVQIYDTGCFDALSFNIRLARRYFYVSLSVLLPINLLAVLSIVPFILPPEESEKVDFSMTVMLAFAVILTVVDEQVPHTSDNVCILVVHISLLLILSFLSVVGNVLVVSLRIWDETADKETAISHSVRHKKHTDVPEENMTSMYSQRTQALTEVDNVSSLPFDSTMTLVTTRKRCHNFFQGTRASKLNTAFALFACILLILIEAISKIMYSS
ncbi:unnamed protein product [Candidula unifasciata]|uniref:Uncharacterized protein n=1 Tax=Candidula unifasciata TaxID=100452 RepID=A0A8S3YL31_9EUPU|nr:unnamed protein product [Candidula unifasciata]